MLSMLVNRQGKTPISVSNSAKSILLLVRESYVQVHAVAPTSPAGLLAAPASTSQIARSLSRAFMSEDGLPQPIEFFIASDASAIVEHTKRVLRCDISGAQRLERRWIEFVMAQEEMEAGGEGRRFKRRKAREARIRLADEMSLSIRTRFSVWSRLRIHVTMALL